MKQRFFAPIGVLIRAEFRLWEERLRLRSQPWGEELRKHRSLPIHITLLAAVAFVIGFCLVGAQVYAPQPAAAAATLDFFQHAGYIFTRVPRNFDGLLITAAFVVACIAPGYLFTGACRVTWRNPVERLLFSTVIGLALMTFVFLAFGSVGLLRPLPIFIVNVVLLVAAGVIVRRELRYAPRPAPAARIAKVHWGNVALAAIVIAYLFVILLPPALHFEDSFDGVYYHLAEAKRWAIHGGFYNLITAEHAWYVALPHYQEDLFAGLIVIGGLVGAKAVVWIQTVLAVASTCLLTYEFIGSISLGLLASIAFLGTPVFMLSATAASNDIPSAAATTLAIYALLRWRKAPDQVGFLVVAGALIGYCAGVKGFGLLSAATLGAFVLTSALTAPAGARSQVAGAVRSVAIFAAAFLVFVLPSCINGWLWLGNPYWPLFGGPQIENGIAVGYRSHILSSLLLLPWNMLVDPTYKNVLGPLFVIMAIPALLALIFRGRNRIVLTLAIIGAVWSLLYFITGAFEGRYAEAIFPIVAIVLVYPLVRPIAPQWRRLTFRYVLGCAFAAIMVLNLPFLLSTHRRELAGGQEGGVSYDWAYLYENSPYDAEYFLSPMATFMNNTLTPSDKVYDTINLALVNLNIVPELYFDAPPFAPDWNLTSANAPAEFAANGIGYLATYGKNVAALLAGPLGPHLREVKRFSATPPAADQSTDEVLFRFTGQ